MVWAKWIKLIFELQVAPFPACADVLWSLSWLCQDQAPLFFQKVLSGGPQSPSTFAVFCWSCCFPHMLYAVDFFGLFLRNKFRLLKENIIFRKMGARHWEWIKLQHFTDVGT